MKYFIIKFLLKYKYFTPVILLFLYVCLTLRLYSFILNYTTNFVSWDHLDVLHAIVSEKDYFKVFL